MPYAFVIFESWLWLGEEESRETPFGVWVSDSFLRRAGLAVLRREETPGHEVGDKTVGDSTIQSRVRCVRYDERKHEYQYREGVCEVVAV